ncbi:MAG: hypothetical protein KY434_04750 [Actinobacteria bacterium]|nr:hypothetical protein [Actinomycetota bacterium]
MSGAGVSDEDTTSTGDGPAGADDGQADENRDEVEALQDRIADARRRADDVSRESAADPSLHVPHYDMAGEEGADAEGETAGEGTDGQGGGSPDNG